MNKKLAIGALITAIGAGTYYSVTNHVTKQHLPVEECEKRMLQGTNFELRERTIMHFGRYFDVYESDQHVGVLDEIKVNVGLRFNIYAGEKQKLLGYSEEKVLS